MAIDQDLRRGLAVAIEPYRGLLEDFVRGELTADEFEGRYLTAYLGDDADSPDEVFVVVDRFFGDVDSFVADPELRKHTHRAVGPTELKRHAAELLRAAGYEVEPSPA